MNKTLLYIALGLGAFLVYRQMQQPVALPPPSGMNPAGGTQQTAPGDLFGQAMGLLGKIFDTVQTYSQTSAKPV